MNPKIQAMVDSNSSHKLAHEYWHDELSSSPSLACLITASNASVERANSRAKHLYTRSPNIGHGLVEALLVLRSIQKKLPGTFDNLAKKYIHEARTKAKAKIERNQGKFLDDDVDLDF